MQLSDLNHDCRTLLPPSPATQQSVGLAQCVTMHQHCCWHFQDDRLPRTCMVKGPDSIWQDVCWTASIGPTRLRNGGRSESGTALLTSRPERPGSQASPPAIPSLRWNIVLPIANGCSRQWHAPRHDSSSGSRQLPLLCQTHLSAAQTPSPGLGCTIWESCREETLLDSLNARSHSSVQLTLAGANVLVRSVRGAAIEAYR